MHRLSAFGSVLGPDFDPARQVTGLESRQDRGLDNVFRECIGQLPFEAVSHFDSHLSFAGRHNQKYPVVFILLTDLPAPPQLVAIVFERRPLEGFQRDDHQLIRCFRFQARERIGQGRPSRWVKQPGLIDHAPAQRGKRERLRGAGTNQADPGNGENDGAAGP